MTKYRINSHGHLLPDPDQIPQFMKDKEIFWIDEDRTHMRQKGWSRPITDKSFFLKEKLVWMERHKINHEVILNLSQLYCNGLERQLTKDIIRFQNDFNGQTQAENKKKITAGFVVQPLHMDDALNEIERCVTDLGLKLLCLPTHYLNKKNEWLSVADKSVEPIFQLANEYNLAVEIHPYDGPKMIGLKNEFWRFHLVWMCAQTADTYHFFTLLDFPDKFPNVRTAFAHGNQFGQVNLGRRTQGFEGRPDLFQKASHPTKSIGIENVFYDTLVHDVLSLEMLVRRQGVNQVIAGLDDPYPLGEMEGIWGGYPGKVIDDGVHKGVITKEDRDNIWGRNVLRWLGEDNLP